MLRVSRTAAIPRDHQLVAGAEQREPPLSRCSVNVDRSELQLTHRKLLQSKAIAIENDLRATLRNFGRKVGGSE